MYNYETNILIMIELAHILAKYASDGHRNYKTYIEISNHISINKILRKKFLKILENNPQYKSPYPNEIINIDELIYLTDIIVRKDQRHILWDLINMPYDKHMLNYISYIDNKLLHHIIILIKLYSDKDITLKWGLFLKFTNRYCCLCNVSYDEFISICKINTVAIDKKKLLIYVTSNTSANEGELCNLLHITLPDDNDSNIIPIICIAVIVILLLFYLIILY